MSTRSTNKMHLVRDALQELCEKHGTTVGPFRQHFSARQVAEKAGCSEDAARKWLNHLAQFRGYERRLINSIYGYRYCKDFDY